MAKAFRISADEADIWLLVDDQLRQVGWEPDTVALRYSAETRPEKGPKMATADIRHAEFMPDNAGQEPRKYRAKKGGPLHWGPTSR